MNMKVNAARYSQSNANEMPGNAAAIRRALMNPPVRVTDNQPAKVEQSQEAESTWRAPVETMRGYVKSRCSEMNICADEVCGGVRTADILSARHQLVYELRQRFPMKSNAEIGRVFGIDPTTVIHAVQKVSGVKAARQYPKVSDNPDLYAAIKADFEAGLSAQEAALRHGISRTTVSRLAREGDWTSLAPKRRRRWGPKKYGRVSIEDVKADFMAGMKTIDIAEKHKISERTIGRVRKSGGWVRPG